MTHKRTRTDGKWQLLSFFSSSSSNLQVWQRDRDSNGRREKRTLGGGQLEIFDFYNSENFLDRFFCCFLAHAFPVHPVWGCVTDECEFNRQEKHSPDRIGPKETFSPTAVYWQVKRSAPSLAVQQWRWLKKKTRLSCVGGTEKYSGAYLDVESRRRRRSSSTAPTTTAASFWH